MSRMHSSSSHAQLGSTKSALTVLLRQQQESAAASAMASGVQTPSQSPYKSKQAMSGLGRNAKAQQLERKSAKGLLRSLSAAQLEPLPQRPGQGQRPISQGNFQPQPQQFNRQAPLANPAGVFPPQQQYQSSADIWQADPSKPGSAQRGAKNGFDAFVPGKAGETVEAHAYRSLPSHNSAYSHYYRPAESRLSRVHVHQYPDGSVVEECTCERGAKMVEADQRASNPAAAARQQQREEEKESQSQSRVPQANTLSPLKSVPPSQVARAEIAYAKQLRPVDTSRQHSAYAASFKPHAIEKFSKLGKGYFASHNKSYIRRCLQDPSYGFQLDEIKNQSQNDPSLPNFAAEISREHTDPSTSLRSVINPVNWPDTTHHADFAAPSAELIKSYKRVGRDYRQAGNRSYIRENLIDPEHFRQPAAGAGASQPAAGLRVPFTADTTHHNSYVDFTSHYPTMRQQQKAKVLFGMESGPAENIWQQWDDNCIDPNEA